MLLALMLGVAMLGQSTATYESCPRGCNAETGDCWRLLTEVYSDGMSQPPTLMFVGEPYPTEQDASCGAKRLRATGVCVGLPTYNANVPVGRITFTKDDLSYPGTDDCYGDSASSISTSERTLSRSHKERARPSRERQESSSR